MQFLSKYRFAFTYPCPRKLREIMQMSLIERENKDNIVKIWMDYHKERDQNIAYIVSKTEYQLLQHNAKSSPLFLLPLKRKAGHFVLIGQVQQNSILFTYLEDYKKAPTFSSPYYIVTLFDELLFTKNLVLLRGDIMDYKVDRDEAFFLTNQFLRFYLTENLYNKYVHSLNHDQEAFDYEDFRNQFSI